MLWLIRYNRRCKRKLHKEHRVHITAKLARLNELVIDKYISEIEKNEDLRLTDIQGAITLLKNNKVVEDKKIFSESDLIDELIDEI